MKTRFQKLKILLIAASLGSAVLALAHDCSATGQKFKIDLPPAIPADLWEILIPKDNPMTEAKVALGRDLYFDKRLSGDRTKRSWRLKVMSDE